MEVPMEVDNYNVGCTPEGVLNDWSLRDVTVESLEQATEEFIETLKGYADQIAAVDLGSVNYENSIKPMEYFHRDFFTKGRPLDMPQHMSTCADVRKAAVAARKKYENCKNEICARTDLYQRYLIVRDNGMKDLSSEQARFVRKLIFECEEFGLHLTKDVKDKVEELKKRETELSCTFGNNNNEDNTTVTYAREELEGMAEDFLDALPKTRDGKLELTIKYNHNNPLYTTCKNPQSRKKMMYAAMSKCISTNTDILEELLAVRHQMAQLLGFKTFAHYILRDKMAKTPEAVAEFLQDLRIRMHPLFAKEKELMLSYKKKECLLLGVPFDDVLHIYDIPYYQEMVKKEEYNIDTNVLREYFPLEKVISGLLHIYQRLLSLKFEKIENPSVWDKEVLMYSTRDLSSDKLLGYFYLDLHPRTGKYSHTGAFPFQQPCEIDGVEQIGLCAVMCNFSKPTENAPALLHHYEVVSLFHEFGHLMATLCAKTKISYFGGTEVQRDFLETPSQMLEYWCYEKASITLMSEHYRTKEPLPVDLLENLVRSKKANVAWFNMRQVYLSVLDQILHSKEHVNSVEVFTNTYKDVLGIEVIKGTNDCACFPHPGGKGYCAQYYSFPWCKIHAADMYMTNFAGGKVLDPAAGDKYRKIVLEPGASRDAMDIMIDFLGREPTVGSYMRTLGL